MKDQQYHPVVTWTGNTGSGTSDYRSYERDHTIAVNGKPPIPGTSEVSLKGNKVRYNPEELLVAAISACHMMWYLHLCAVNHIVVVGYVDKAVGTMEKDADGGGRFVDVVLHPEITITGGAEDAVLQDLQHQTNRLCCIANSCNFPVRHEPVYVFT